jgi:hypothetical protein
MTGWIIKVIPGSDCKEAAGKRGNRKKKIVKVVHIACGALVQNEG